MKTIKQTVKMPSLMYVSIFDVMYDRTKGLENSPYKIVRTYTSWESIKQKVLPMLLETSKSSKEEVNKKLDTWLKKCKDKIWNRFSVYDYNPVKWLLMTQQWIEVAKTQWYFNLPIVNKTSELVWWYWEDWTTNSETNKNYFLNDNQSTYELVEYVTSDKRYIFVNGDLFYYGPKLTNIWDIREATYSIIPWTGNAVWAADKQLNLQQIQNTLWNAFIDNIKLNLGPMFKITGNLPMWKSWTIDFKAFRAFKTNWVWDIEKVQLWVSDFAPMNFMQMVETASQKETWMTNYVMWWWGAVERTQWWIDLKFNQYKSKLTPITDSIDQMMWNIARSWVMMYLKFFTMEELGKLGVQVEKVFEPNDEWRSIFKTITLNGIDIRDIVDETNITFTYNSLDKVTKENTRNLIMSNLQYLLQYSWWTLNMDEVSKIMAWLDFDPIKLFKSKSKQAFEEKWQGWQLTPDLSQLMWGWWEPTQESWYDPAQEDDADYNDDDVMSQLQDII